MNEFKTKDKALSGFLMLCYNVRFLGLETIEGIIHFVFTPADLCVTRLKDFNNQTTFNVNAKQYSKSLHDLGKMIAKEKEFQRTGIEKL